MTPKKPKKPARKPAAKKPAQKKSDPREEINIRAIIGALEKFILAAGQNGEVMSATQVTAALALLKKILPDASEPKQKTPDAPASAHEDALAALE